MIKKEQHKVNPPPRDDDSVGEITDLEDQQILSKYYKKENPEFYRKQVLKKHKCGTRLMRRDKKETEVVEMEVRHKDKIIFMED